VAYAAARDLPAGATLHHGDLVVVRVRLPTTALRHYLQPTPGQTVAGRVLAAPVRHETLVPAELLLASNDAADQVELPVQADPGDMAQGLRPGDRVQVLAAYTEGARRGNATVLLPTAEVVRVLEDPGGLTGGGRPTGVQLRMPNDRVPQVAAAIATARIGCGAILVSQPGALLRDARRLGPRRFRLAAPAIPAPAPGTCGPPARRRPAAGA